MSAQTEVILAELELKASALAEIDSRREELLDERRDLILKAREAGVTYEAIGNVLGTSAQAAVNVITRLKRKETAA